jgi:hypothetical protein
VEAYEHKDKEEADAKDGLDAVGGAELLKLDLLDDHAGCEEEDGHPLVARQPLVEEDLWIQWEAVTMMMTPHAWKMTPVSAILDCSKSK